MKKTLITSALVLGLAAVSSATSLTLDQSQLTAANGTYTMPSDISIGTGSSNFYVTMVLDATKFQDAMKGASITNTELITTNGGDNGAVKIGLGMSTSADGTGLYGSWGNNTTFSRGIALGNGMTVDLNSLSATFTANTYKSVAITYSMNGAGAFTHLTLVAENGSATTISGVDGNLKAGSFGNLDSFTFNSEYIQYLTIADYTGVSNYLKDNSVGQTYNLSAIAAAQVANAVPEPATATLSLLALAGLAARRRRK